MGNIKLAKPSSGESTRALSLGGQQIRKPGIKLARKFDWLALILLTGQGMKPGTYVHGPGN
ncbi:MAG: hypothetical protein P0Y58_11405 [Candidatus Pseudomonas phytovorans]|uniref:Uncharacterized protein n=1 Tax=Candidatus Pseudomonas phytovorans TaxID=3121377 RepID=A0AAJ6BCP6_9PSED|nr:hypothetical protein [Pseudomonas sp.]WEK32765.1 MAG: hypothetical protein P0Y58_11405 [Pseudomonas sp.]